MGRTRSRCPSRWGMAFIAACTLSAGTAAAEKARFYNLEGFGTWLDGNPESTGVTEEGEVILAVPARERYADPAAAFGAAAALGDEIIVARNDDGRVLAIDRAGKTRELFQAEDGLVSAMVATSDRLFIAVSPPARIFSVDKKGKSTEFHTPDAGFIWDMAIGSDGSLYAVTGEPGTVIRIDKTGRSGDILFEPEQEHMRSIAFDATMGVFAGGGERGILYRAPPGKPKAFRALFDTGHPEVTSIGRGIYLTFCLVFMEHLLAWPEHWALELYYVGMPVLGLVV